MNPDLWYVWYIPALLCLTLRHLMDCSPPGSPVHGIFQARVLEWGAISSSRGSSQPRDQTHDSMTPSLQMILYHCSAWKDGTYECDLIWIGGLCRYNQFKLKSYWIFLGSKITVNGNCSHEIKRCLLFERKAMTNLDSTLKSRDITLLTTKCPYSQSYGFTSDHVHNKSAAIQKAEHWRMDDFELRLSRVSWAARSNQVNPKGNQPWILIGRTADAPVHWPSDVKSQLTGKDPDAAKDWRPEKGATEDEMDRKHHQLSGQEFGQTLGRKWNTAEPGMLPSMGLHTVGHDLASEK